MQTEVKTFFVDNILLLLYNKYMKHNQSAEDYLETILLLCEENEYVHRVDVARRMNVSQPAVQKAVKLLQAGGFIECDGLHINLTQKGVQYAKDVYERHCTIKRFLQKLGVGEACAEEDACEMEHVISEATFEKIKEFVNKN